jgi:hypothetical protein
MESLLLWILKWTHSNNSAAAQITAIISNVGLFYHYFTWFSVKGYLILYAFKVTGIPFK